jgi:hypothetical protein
MKCPSETTLAIIGWPLGIAIVVAAVIWPTGIVIACVLGALALGFEEQWHKRVERRRRAASSGEEGWTGGTEGSGGAGR